MDFYIVVELVKESYILALSYYIEVLELVYRIPWEVKVLGRGVKGKCGKGRGKADFKWTAELARPTLMPPSMTDIYYSIFLLRLIVCDYECEVMCVWLIV